MDANILRFAKMQALGNDFMVVNTRALPKLSASGEEAVARRLANRRKGVGFDQLLLLGAPDNPRADFFYRVINADGGEVFQCGNGLRCAGLFIENNRLSNKSSWLLETARGMFTVEALDQHDHGQRQFKANMDSPCFVLPSADEYALDPIGPMPRFQRQLNGQLFEFCALYLGNPHAVVFVDDLEAAPIAKLVASIDDSPAFPEGVNVGFAKIIARDRLALRVVERGAGETPACASGACAAQIAAQLTGLIDKVCQIEMSGGTLTVSWGGESNQPVWQSGPACHVYDGQIDLNAAESF